MVPYNGSDLGAVNETTWDKYFGTKVGRHNKRFLGSNNNMDRQTTQVTGDADLTESRKNPPCEVAKRQAAVQQAMLKLQPKSRPKQKQKPNAKSKLKLKLKVDSGSHSAITTVCNYFEEIEFGEVSKLGDMIILMWEMVSHIS